MEIPDLRSEDQGFQLWIYYSTWTRLDPLAFGMVRDSPGPPFQHRNMMAATSCAHASRPFLRALDGSGLAAARTMVKRRALHRLALLCAALALLCALLTFIGWISGFSLLASFRARYIPMAPSTALCFSLLGLGLMARLRLPRTRAVPLVLALVVLIVASAKLIEFLTGLSLGIDAWLVRDPEMFGAVPTGRMAPVTAANFLTTAFGVLALTVRSWRKSAGVLGLVATVVSAVVLVGYWYGTPLLYGGNIIPVALSTALAFALCGIAIVASAGAAVLPLRAFSAIRPALCSCARLCRSSLLPRSSMAQSAPRSCKMHRSIPPSSPLSARSS